MPEADEDIRSLLPSSLNDTIGADRIADAQKLLRELTRCQGASTNPAAPHDEERKTTSFLSTLKKKFSFSRTLTEEERRAFERDGLLICRDWFSTDQLELLRQALESDFALRDHALVREDAEGLSTKLTLWWYFGEDTYSNFGRSASLVNAVAELMGGTTVGSSNTAPAPGSTARPTGTSSEEIEPEPYLSHCKVLLKEPQSGGAWEWHQDFGYWYAQGLLEPDKIVSAIIPIDENTLENGCMKLLAGSHKLGRLDHGTFGGQAAADPERVLAVMQRPSFPLVNLELRPGDVCFMHANTLHASAPNMSKDQWRRNLIVCYNERENEPGKNFRRVGEGQPLYNPISVLPDAELVVRGVVPLDPDRNKAMRL